MDAKPCLLLAPQRALQQSNGKLCHTMRFGSTAIVQAKCKLKYYRILECASTLRAAVRRFSDASLADSSSIWALKRSSAPAFALFASVSCLASSSTFACVADACAAFISDTTCGVTRDMLCLTSHSLSRVACNFLIGMSTLGDAWPLFKDICFDLIGTQEASVFAEAVNHTTATTACCRLLSAVVHQGTAIVKVTQGRCWLSAASHALVVNCRLLMFPGVGCLQMNRAKYQTTVLALAL